MGGPEEQMELTVIAKAYDLILWSCNHTSKFPRNYRFVLREQIAWSHRPVLLNCATGLAPGPVLYGPSGSHPTTA